MRQLYRNVSRISGETHIQLCMLFHFIMLYSVRVVHRRLYINIIIEAHEQSKTILYIEMNCDE